MSRPGPASAAPGRSASGPIRAWGVVGTGIGSQFIGSVHAHSPQRVVAVAARDARRTEAAARAHGVDRWFTDVTQLINDPEVEADYIGTPHPVHCDQALEAIAAGKHVLIEKPIAMTATDVRAVLDAATEAARPGREPAVRCPTAGGRRRTGNLS